MISDYAINYQKSIAISCVQAYKNQRLLFEPQRNSVVDIATFGVSVSTSLLRANLGHPRSLRALSRSTEAVSIVYIALRNELQLWHIR